MGIEQKCLNLKFEIPTIIVHRKNVNKCKRIKIIYIQRKRVFDVILFYTIYFKCLPLNCDTVVVVLVVTHLTEDKGLFRLIYDITLRHKTRLELINRLQNRKVLNNSWILFVKITY